MVHPNLLVSSFPFFGFSQRVWREPELTWTVCAFEFKRSVCCGKATGGKARGRQFGANLVLPYVVRTVHIFAWSVEAFSWNGSIHFHSNLDIRVCLTPYIVIKIPKPTLDGIFLGPKGLAEGRSFSKGIWYIPIS